MSDAGRSLAGDHGDATVAEMAQNTPQRRRVLIVDDLDEIRLLFRVVLELADTFEVVTAASGTEALGILASCDGAFDAVVTDVCMPGVDGFVVADTVRERWPDVAVVVCSGISLARHGQWQVISKPAAADRLADIIDGAIEERAQEII